MGSASTANSQRDSQNGIGAQLGLVGGSVQRKHESIDGTLIGNVNFGSQKLRGNNSVDVFHGSGDTLSVVNRGITVTEFQGFMDTGGGARGNGGSEETFVGNDINLENVAIE